MVKNRFLEFTQSTLRNPYLWVVITLTCAGFFLRIFALGDDPFWVDEATSVLAAKGLLTNGIPVLPSGEIYSRDPLSTYLIAISMNILGETEFAARLPSAIFGTLVIPLVYLIGKIVSGKNVGLIAAFSTTFSFFEIAWSRQARMYSLYQFFFVLGISVYLLLKTVRFKYEIIYLALLLGAVFGVYFSHETWMILPTVIALDFLLTFRVKNIIVVVLRYLIITITLILTILIMVYQRPILPGWIYNIFTGQNVNKIVFWNYPGAFLKETYNVLWWLAILGSCINLLKNWGKAAIVLISFWCTLFIFSYFGNVVTQGIGSGWWPRYIYFIIPLFLILSADGIYMIVSNIVVDFVKKAKTLKDPFRDRFIRGHFPILNILIIGISILLVTTPAVGDIGFRLNDLSEIAEPQSDFRGAAQLVKTYMQEQDIVITNRTPQVFYYLGKVDYSGNDSFIKDRDGELIDFYTGASIIKSEEQLKEIVNNNPRGWVLQSSPDMKLTGGAWIKQSLQLFGKIPSTLDNQIVDVYCWGIMGTYSDDFSTTKWNEDKYSSDGIDRSFKITNTQYVLYPTVADKHSGVKYHFNFTGTQNPTTITVTGNGRDEKNSLSVWVSPDNINYTKVIEFGPTQETKQANLDDYIENNQLWIDFRFYLSSGGQNVPRILNFKIQSPPTGRNANITPY